MAQNQTSKYRNVNYKNMKTNAESALTEVNLVEANLNKIKADLSNSTILPNQISTVALTALNFTINPVSGAGSTGALKKYLTTLKSIASKIETLQTKWKSFEQLQEKIKKEKAKKGTSDYNREYYNSLITEQKKLAPELLNLESQVDNLVRSICA